jgi:hypothetical protein
LINFYRPDLALSWRGVVVPLNPPTAFFRSMICLDKERSEKKEVDNEKIG